MKIRKFFPCTGLIATIALCCASSAWVQLRVGTGKVEVTPNAANLPSPFLSIHDPLYTRAILIESGKTRALLMNLDVGKISQNLYSKLSAEISTRYGIPADNMVISAVHDHASVPELGGGQPGGPPQQGGPGGGAPPQASPAMQAFADKAYKGMLQAVEQAQASLQPAEMGYGEGKLYLNVNRDAIDPKRRQWAEEPNLDFPSDKTLYVLEFRKPNGGDPIAVYMSYAMHSITMFLRREISGDFPEVAEKYIENTYDNKVVAMWAIGPAGDQDPLYIRAIWALGAEQVKGETDPNNPADADPARLRLFRGGTQRPPVPLNPKLADQSWQVVQAIGTLTAEEAMRVMSEIPYFTSTAVIQGASKTVSCPGRRRNSSGGWEDGSPVSISVGALRIGDEAIGRTDSEIYNKIGVEARDGSPFRHTMIINLANGAGGYIPADDAYGRGSFQVVGNRIKPGCAEMGIVNGVDGILRGFMEGEAKK
jgi:neutral ceramidase